MAAVPAKTQDSGFLYMVWKNCFWFGKEDFDDGDVLGRKISFRGNYCALIQKHLKITTAESCTGGLLAGRLLDIAGASEVYEEGYITYSDASKAKLLGVKKETLEKYSAVSEKTAEEMVRGAAKAANADAALATTGIAGPGGGTKEKPVGLIYVSAYLKGDVLVKECRFHGTRAQNRALAVTEALRLMEIMLDKKEEKKGETKHADSTNKRN